MAEIREVTDPRVEARLKRALNDLREFAPDGVISGLDSRKKKLGERLTRLYREIGYESRRDMLEAYGFTFAINEQGGGVRTVDIDEVLNELGRRYDGQRCATSLDQVIEENPDLKPQLKTVQNTLSKKRGITLAKELKRRGIIAGKTPEAKDAALIEMVEFLRETYADTADKPKSLADLFGSHPEYAPLKGALTQRARELFGAPAADYLRSVGVLRANNFTQEELEQALALLRDRILPLPESEKPVHVGELVDYASEFKDVLKMAQKERAITKKSLQDQGLLRLSDAKKQEKRKEVAAASLRMATVDELCAIWNWAELPPVVRKGDAMDGVLPTGIVELDTAAQAETRESLACRVTEGDAPTLEQTIVSARGPLRAETLLCALRLAGVFSDDDFLTESGARNRYLRFVSEGAKPPSLAHRLNDDKGVVRTVAEATAGSTVEVVAQSVIGGVDERKEKLAAAKRAAEARLAAEEARRVAEEARRATEEARRAAEDEARIAREQAELERVQRDLERRRNDFIASLDETVTDVALEVQQQGATAEELSLRAFVYTETRKHLEEAPDDDFAWKIGWIKAQQREMLPQLLQRWREEYRAAGDASEELIASSLIAFGLTDEDLI